MNGRGQLAHAGEGGGGAPGRMLGRGDGRAREKGGIQAIKQEGVEHFQNNIHGDGFFLFVCRKAGGRGKDGGLT